MQRLGRPQHGDSGQQHQHGPVVARRARLRTAHGRDCARAAGDRDGARAEMELHPGLRDREHPEVRPLELEPRQIRDPDAELFLEQPGHDHVRQVGRQDAHAADHRAVDERLDHDRLACRTLARRLAEQPDDPVRDGQQRSGPCIRGRHDERHHAIHREHGPDHAVGGSHLQAIEEQQGDAAVESTRLHDRGEQERGEAQEHDGRGEAAGRLRKRRAACDSTSSIGSRMPLTPTGTASVIHTIATHETTASVALPSADRCAGAATRRSRRTRATLQRSRSRHASARDAIGRPRADRRVASPAIRPMAAGWRVLSSGGVPIALSVTGMLPVRRSLGQQARSSIEMS